MRTFRSVARSLGLRCSLAPLRSALLQSSHAPPRSSLAHRLQGTVKFSFACAGRIHNFQRWMRRTIWMWITISIWIQLKFYSFAQCFPLSLALFLRLSRLLFVCLRNGNCNGNCDSDVVCVCVSVICRAVKFEYCLQCVCRGCLVPPAPCCKLANKLGPSANRSKSSAPSSRVETSRGRQANLCVHTLYTLMSQ